MNEFGQRIAAVRAHPGASDLLAAFARDVMAEGYRVHGLVQHPRQRPDGGLGLVVEDLESGRCYDISQNLGPGSESCNVDPRGLAEASVVLRRAIAMGAELVVVSRFGKLEASGHGLAAEMLEVMVAGIPLLTVVDDRNMGAWNVLTGGSGLILEADAHRLRLWWQAFAP
jgi:nucleoside-triphosphatase THEP1